MNYRIGVDIGGTSAKLAVVDSDFNVTDKHGFPTGKDCTPEDIINGIIANSRTLMAKYKIDAVGIGSPGTVDPERGIVVVAGNLPFRNEPVVEKVAKALGVPTFIENDGSCALIGETAAGASRGCHDAVIITIGTGIGGAIMINDRVVRGFKGGAGELGHFVIDRNGEDCPCGLKGCFEQYASASALVRQTAGMARANPTSILANCAMNGVNGKTVFDAVEKKCPVAKFVLEEYGRILSDGINSLVHIFQPEMFVISGGIAVQGENLLKYIRPNLIHDVAIATSELGGNGGIIGAAILGTEYAR